MIVAEMTDLGHNIAINLYIFVKFLTLIIIEMRVNGNWHSGHSNTLYIGKK